MCELCTRFGTKPLLDPKVLRQAMDAITPVMLKDGSQTEHLRAAVDAWMGFQPGSESEDQEQAEAWERGHR